LSHSGKWKSAQAPRAGGYPIGDGVRALPVIDLARAHAARSPRSGAISSRNIPATA